VCWGNDASSGWTCRICRWKRAHSFQFWILIGRRVRVSAQNENNNSFSECGKRKSLYWAHRRGDGVIVKEGWEFEENWIELGVACVSVLGCVVDPQHIFKHLHNFRVAQPHAVPNHQGIITPVISANFGIRDSDSIFGNKGAEIKNSRAWVKIKV